MPMISASCAAVKYLSLHYQKNLVGQKHKKNRSMHVDEYFENVCIVLKPSTDMNNNVIR